MTISEQIHQQVLILPTPLQIKVLDFIEYLISQTDSETNERLFWQDFSLTMAMRGMEDEEDLYTIADLKHE